MLSLNICTEIKDEKYQTSSKYYETRRTSIVHTSAKARLTVLRSGSGSGSVIRIAIKIYSFVH